MTRGARSAATPALLTRVTFRTRGKADRLEAVTCREGRRLGGGQ